MKFDPNADLQLTYKFDYTQNHYTPEAQGVAAAYFQGLGPGLGDAVLAQLALQPDPSILTPVSTERPDAVNNAYTTDSFTRNFGHNLTARYDLNDAVSFTNILAFRTSRVQAGYQLEGMGGIVNMLPAFGAVGQPYLLLVNATELDQQQWSDEFQVNYNSKWLTLTAGYIHFHDTYKAGAFVGSPNVIQFSTVPDYVIPFVGSQKTEVQSQSDAWYMQPEIHLTDKLDVVLGARLTVDHKEIEDNTLVGLPTAHYTYDDTRPTFLAGVNYKPTPDILTYAKFVTGYISGGFLATRQYDPEKAESYEAGVKADLLDRRLRTNLAIFHVKYTDLQYNASGLVVGVPAAPEVVVNGGDSEATGFEFEGTAVPIDGLTLSANLGYTDFKYTRVDPVIGDINTYLPINRPKWTSDMSAQYETGEVLAGGHLVLRVDANYRSKTYLAFGAPTEAIKQALTTDNSWLVNARVALRDFEVQGARFEVALWGRNLNDNRQLSNVSSLGFLFPGSYERARTFGVDINFQY